MRAIHRPVVLRRAFREQNAAERRRARHDSKTIRNWTRQARHQKRLSRVKRNPPELLRRLLKAPKRGRCRVAPRRVPASKRGYRAKFKKGCAAERGPFGVLASTSTVPLKPWTWIINERDRLSNRTPAARSNNGDENALFPRSAANCVAEEL